MHVRKFIQHLVLSCSRYVCFSLFLASCGQPPDANVEGSATQPQLRDNAPQPLELGELSSELRQRKSRGCQSQRALELEILHTHWWLEGLELPTDCHGNTVVDNVVFMPLPEAPGDGSPGSIDVTLSSNQWFFLPLFGIFGTSYSDGTPPGPFEPVSIFETLDINFSIDGVSVVTNSNVMEYFFKFELDPPIPYDDPPLAAVIWGEEVSILHTPLSKGEHTFTLDVLNTEPVWGGYFLEWHNVWNVTVVRGRH